MPRALRTCQRSRRPKTRAVGRSGRVYQAAAPADRAGGSLGLTQDGLAGFRQGLGVDAGAVDAARGGCEKRQVVEEVAFDVRPGGFVDQTDRLGRTEQDVFGFRPDWVVPEPAVAREHGQAPALGLEELEEVGALVVGSYGQAAPGEAFGRLRAEYHVDVLVPRPPETRAIHEVADQTDSHGVDGRSQALESH